MIIFNITAILETNHTISTDANFKTRNLKPENQNLIELRLDVKLHSINMQHEKVYKTVKL